MRAMGTLLALLLLAASAPDSTPATKTYQTRKTMQQLEKCLTDKLSELGDVAAVRMEDSTNLVLRGTGDKPMVIELAPPTVTVTTEFATGARPLVEDCV